LTSEIVNNLYIAAVIIEKKSGKVLFNHASEPFEDFQFQTAEDLNLYFEKEYNKKASPLFDTIRHNEKDYWISRTSKAPYIYYYIQECKYLDMLLLAAKKNSTIDGLTNCLNKMEIQRQISNFLLTYLRYKANQFSIIMLDIDHFKKVNDTYGHLTGDYVLRELSNLIRNTARECDMCGRFGGEEFLILLPETKVVGAIKFAKRVNELCEKYNFTFQDIQIKITVSLGVTSIDKTDSLTSIIDRCDTALYDAKKNGRNRVEYR